jgi:hypothetical protein
MAQPSKSVSGGERKSDFDTGRSVDDPKAEVGDLPII